jgi:hypothetical protein
LKHPLTTFVFSSQHHGTSVLFVLYGSSVSNRRSRLDVATLWWCNDLCHYLMRCLENRQRAFV